MPRYRGTEINFQINQINNIMTNQISEAQNVKKGIQNFINNTDLQSEAYTNQKNYFNVVYISLYNAIERFAGEFVNANSNLQNKYTYVDNDVNAYINTDELAQEMGNLISQANYWLGLVDSLPYAQYYADLNGSLKRNINGVIERMNDFSQNSSTNYDSARSYLNIIIQGMTAIKNDCWDATNGTFNYSGMDLNWVNDLNKSIAKSELTKEGFTESEIDNLEKMGVDIVDYYNMYSYVKENGTKEELELLKQLGHGNYNDAFSIDSGKISEETMAYVSNFVLSIYKNDFEKSNFDNYEKVLNGLLLSEHINYLDSNQYKYLLLISAHTEKLLQDYSESMFLESLSAKDREELTLEVSRLMELRGLYLGLAYIVTESAIKFGHGSDLETPGMGLRGIEIGDLNYIGNGEFEFDFQCIVDASLNGNELIKGYQQNANTSIVSTDMEKVNNEYQKFLDDLAKEKELLLINMMFSSLSVIAAIYCPAAVPFIAVVNGITSGSIDKTVTNGMTVTGNIYNISSTDVQQAKQVYTMVRDLYDYINNNSDELESKKQKELFEALFGNDQFELTWDGKSVIVGEGFYDVHTLSVLNDWCNNGISSFVDTEKTNNIKMILDDESYIKDMDEELYNNCKTVIDGGFIIGETISISDYFEAIEEIDKKYNLFLYKSDLQYHDTSIVDDFKYKDSKVDSEGYK